MCSLVLPGWGYVVVLFAPPPGCTARNCARVTGVDPNWNGCISISRVRPERVSRKVTGPPGTCTIVGASAGIGVTVRDGHRTRRKRWPELTQYDPARRIVGPRVASRSSMAP